jgi:uncharacterized protein (TIGR03084 family)
MKDVLEDLAAEHADLDELLSGIDDPTWDTLTPAEPWTIRDQVGHLAYFDEKVAISASDSVRFSAELQRMFDIGVDEYMGEHIGLARAMEPGEVLDWWRRARSEALGALARCEPDERLVWYGPPMRAESSAVARLMETWAHGIDVRDALGVTPTVTDRLFRVADLGVRTFRFSYENRGLPVPDERVRVALRGVTGNLRVWNDGCNNSVTGPVEEFCLVIAQRRNVGDTHLVAEGPIAAEWMDIAQVFAGPPGPGRPLTRS